jgi:hypothetical protein
LKIYLHKIRDISFNIYPISGILLLLHVPHIYVLIVAVSSYDSLVLGPVFDAVDLPRMYDHLLHFNALIGILKPLHAGCHPSPHATASPSEVAALLLGTQFESLVRHVNVSEHQQTSQPMPCINPFHEFSIRSAPKVNLLVTVLLSCELYTALNRMKLRFEEAYPATARGRPLELMWEVVVVYEASCLALESLKLLIRAVRTKVRANIKE